MDREEWVEIHGFSSYGEFVRFEEWVTDAVATGALTEVKVEARYSGSTLLDERWYSAIGGQVWRLVAPEPPFRGVFERVP